MVLKTIIEALCTSPAAYDNSLDQQEESRQSARERHPTEKGLEYTWNLRLQAVISAKRS